MKKTIILLILFCTSWTVRAQEGQQKDYPTIEIDNQASLLLTNIVTYRMVNGIPETPINLKIKGQMNNFDFYVLRLLQNAIPHQQETYFPLRLIDKFPYDFKLVIEELDLSEVEVIPGGIYMTVPENSKDTKLCFPNYTTEPNVIGTYMLASWHPKRLVLPATVTRIEEYAMADHELFWHERLQEVVLPANLKELFCGVFDNIPIIRRIECRSEEPPVLLSWVDWLSDDGKTLQTIYDEVKMDTEEDIKYWEQREYYLIGLLEKLVLVVPKGCREKYASPKTGTLFAWCKEIIEEGEETSVSSPKTAPATADTRSYTLGGQPATPQTRGIVVSQGHKRVK